MGHQVHLNYKIFSILEQEVRRAMQQRREENSFPQTASALCYKYLLTYNLLLTSTLTKETLTVMTLWTNTGIVTCMSTTGAMSYWITTLGRVGFSCFT